MKVTISFDIEERTWDAKASDIDNFHGEHIGVVDLTLEWLETFFKTRGISNLRIDAEVED